mmetsp:Transcript_28729/g.69892  ORF Transcript_28729/g.69892 Transcript_28729/m.69892 type:complete len:371 (+) Transcript_28729:172-1284(+)
MSGLRKRIFPVTILNSAHKESRTVWQESESPSEVVCKLRTTIAVLYVRFLSRDGKTVDYAALGRSYEFANYVEQARHLNTVDVEDMDEDARKAFFLNLYNCMLMHAIVVKGPPTSLMGRHLMYDSSAYIVSRAVYTLTDVEHGVLRGNRPAGSFLMRWKSFAPDDPRFAAVVRLDPRIHFGLNCGAKSCPSIRYYTPENVDSSLQLAASLFVGDDDEVGVDEDNKIVRMSMIFSWFREDFGDDLLSKVASFLDDGDPKRESLLRLSKDGAAHIEFRPYCWDLNSSSVVARQGLLQKILRKGLEKKYLLNESNSGPLVQGARSESPGKQSRLSGKKVLSPLSPRSRQKPHRRSVDVTSIDSQSPAEETRSL